MLQLLRAPTYSKVFNQSFPIRVEKTTGISKDLAENEEKAVDQPTAQN